MRYLLIANPAAGSGKAGRQVAAVLGYFRRRGCDVDLRFTQKAGQAEELAREGARGGYDAIIVGGGDGTINEAINGIAGSPTKLAILPWGTGNVFATEMRFPRGVAALCRQIIRGDSELLDVGLCGGRRFLMMAGAGFDAYSLKQLEGRQGLKRRLGLMAYALASLRAFARYRYPTIRVELADGRADSGSFVIVSNTSRYGDFFAFTPRASPLDGLLDVFVFSEAGRWSTLVLALRYLARFVVAPDLAAPPPLQRSRVYRTSGLRLSSTKTVFSQVDGELGPRLPLEFAILPRAVRLVLPRRRLRRYRARERGAGPSAAFPT